MNPVYATTHFNVAPCHHMSIFNKFLLYITRASVLNRCRHPLLITFCNKCNVTLPTVFILTLLVNFPCGKKLQRLDNTHDFRQTIDYIIFCKRPPAENSGRICRKSEIKLAKKPPVLYQPQSILQ